MVEPVAASISNTQPLRILAVTRKPDSASFEQRVLHFIPHLAAMGIQVTPITLPDSLAGQWQLIAQARQYDVVWWHRHMLSGLLAWRLRATGLPVVFDFDDPLPFSSVDNARSGSRSRRFARMLRLSRLAISSSEYLRELAQPYCDDLPLVPMAIDLPESGEVKRRRGSPAKVELLWLGGRTTQPYLEEIRQPLEELGRTHGDKVKLRLVAHEPMAFGALEVDFRKWSFAEQDASLRECHVGLCPMPATPWTKGKCPFKVLQYMAWAMPWVGAAVGANIVSAGDAASGEARGLCAADRSQWSAHLTRLINDADLRATMGQRGRVYAGQVHDRRNIAVQLADIFRRAAVK